MRRPDRASGPHAVGALEELVRTVAALDGPRAALLLSGLSEALRPTALELLRHVERSSRADRHARLARAFAFRPASAEGAEAIPGRLGVEVRGRLAREHALAEGPGSGPLARWAARLVLELDDR